VKDYGSYSGFCVADFLVSPAVMLNRYGREASRAVALAMFDSVDDIGRVMREVLRGERAERWSEECG
jgi:hypothetical protein